MQDDTTKLTSNTIAQGPMFPEPVKIATIQILGDTIKLIGQGLQTGQFYDPWLTPEQLDLLEIVTEASYDGDPVKFRLGIEALRLKLANDTRAFGQHLCFALTGQQGCWPVHSGCVT